MTADMRVLTPGVRDTPSRTLPRDYFTLAAPRQAKSPFMFLSPPRWAWHPHRAGVAAETIARAWLAHQLDCTAEQLPLSRDDFGRPRLHASLAACDTSWSHSGDGLLVALGRDMDVGIDLERLRPRPRALAVAERYFTAAELAWLQVQAADARDEAFLRLWCAKEAVLKAHGRGLVFGLDKLAFAQGDGVLALVACDPALGTPADWQLLEFIPQPGYRAALAWRRR
jgi:4'-phosphopantetheinyl transferase